MYMGKKYLLTITIPGYRPSIVNVELSLPVQHNASPDKNSWTTVMVSFIDVTGIKPCSDLSPNQNALRIASGTEPTRIRKEDTTPLAVVPFLCSLHHCKRWRRWSTFNGRQRSRRANRPPLCEGVWPHCRPQEATTNLPNSSTCGLERFPSARNDTFVDSELCSYTGDGTPLLQLSDHSFTCEVVQKEAPRFDRGTSRSAIECSTPRQRIFDLRSVGTDTKMLCLEIYRTGQIIPAYEILRKIFLFTSLKKGVPRFEPETSRSAVECSATKLYPRVSESLLCVP
ncbi:uncharacterized protein TNCV_3166991 [Trichonephila clavipes]|uniref:Uncharacterized protein n=1 Tax=Trichonephila clavipes TaxID=2585209 RepID=A0A8X6UWX1_TRICX|nr:uncharacterized protein TNCV_3166991 [Trichonephila clavipes]